jgi:methylase of polypeptide subunit release factors
VPEPQPQITWQDQGRTLQALWRSERGAPPPARVVLADDTLPANTAYKLACEGTGLLWQGDFNNARHLLQALMRRTDRPLRRPVAPGKAAAASGTGLAAATAPAVGAAGGAQCADGAAAAFYRHRQAQGQRARLLAMLLIPLQADYSIALRRAPNLRLACLQAWGPADGPPLPPAALPDGPAPVPHTVAPLRDLLGIVSAFEWRRKGVPIAALGAAPDNRIHPHYGVFSPVRGEYVDLVAHAPLPAAVAAGGPVFDIGTGTGVLAAVLARRSLEPGQRSGLLVVATDSETRALACAQDNLQRLGLLRQVQLQQADLFPAGRAALVVCNPPWLPARPGSPLERAVYDEDSRMLQGFLRRLPEHLLPGGEGWLILSDLAEHLGLRTRQQLLAWVAAAQLQVLGRIDTRPTHRKAADASDPLHAARAAEVTSLWRLGLA